MILSALESIRQKLTLILLTTVGVALALAAAGLLVLEARNEWRAARTALTTQAQVVGLASEAALSFGDRKVGEQNLRVLQAQAGVLAAALYDAEGRLFAHFRVDDDDADAVPAMKPPLGLDFGWTKATVSAPVVSGREAIGSVYVQTRHGLVPRVAEYIGWLVLITAASLAVALLLANRLNQSVTGPIEEVSRVARAVLEQGSYDVRATKRTQDEVGQLVDAFNAMLEELGKRARVLEEANTALGASEARYQLAARGSSAGLWDWDMQAGTMFHSPRLKALLGYSEEEFPDLPDSLTRIMHPEDRGPVNTALQAHLEDPDDRTPYQAECRLQEKDGRWRWFLVTGTAQKDRLGRAYRMAGSLVDISERKESEILLQRSNDAKDEFLATLAHELRNPLAPLRTGVQILRRSGIAPAVQQRTLETMDRQLTHMVRLVDDLLDISRISSGKIKLEMTRTSLRAVLVTALELARPAMDSAGHALQTELPEPDIEVEGDATRLAQAFGNLLNNAAKYTPPGGQVRLRAWREGDMGIVEVQDNGVGIAPDMLDKVFELFTQLSPGTGQLSSGLGIGLYLVRNLVQLHGGTIVARSAGSGGSTFRVALPCLPAAHAAAAPDAAPATPAPAPDLRVLVVDDNVDAAETLSAFLGILGLEVRSAHSGPAALEVADTFDLDAVLLDIGLPGMDGYEVARAFRANPRLAHVHLIALTGWGSEQDRRRAADAGFDHHLTKPVELGQLEEMLRQLPLARRA